VRAPQKTKRNAKRKYGNAGGASLYLLGPSGSSFHPLKLPESTSFTKGCFWIFGQFSICNGDNELPTSIYRLFWPFLSFFDPFCHFFWLENHVTWFLSFSLDVTIHFTFGSMNFLGVGALLRSFGEKSFFQLCAFKLGFHLHLLHLVVFFSLP
jgi:hypothetical protein